MGGSLALGLRRHCAGLFGVDPDPEALLLAESLKLFDRTAADPAVLAGEADLTVLAAPVGAILSLLDDLPTILPGGGMILDLGSTKTEIVRRMASLPIQFDPIGGHPMCGKERGGLANADSAIFHGATFAFTPLPRSSKRICSLAEQIAQALQARPVWLEPEIHDRWVAATSHVPFLVANALAAVTPLEAAALVGPGFRSAARLAPSPWPVMRDILATNRLQIRDRLSCFSSRIQELEKLIEDGDLDGLEDLIAEGAINYEQLIH